MLERIINSKHKFDTVEEIKALNKYKRILVQDSTIIRLPIRLFEIFSGVRNGTTAVCNARIQGVYDLVSRQFVRFSIDPHSKNDQSSALDIDVQPGDLVLRDRGYFLIDSIGKFKKIGADTILRYKSGTKIFDVETGKEIDLVQYLTPANPSPDPCQTYNGNSIGS
ncbi:transposase [bacterium]|nr:transposase [bacterium]